MKNLRVLGIMSGTSMDGVDFALCSATGEEMRLQRQWQTPFPPSLRQRLRLAVANQMSSHTLAQLHHDLGRFYAKAARTGLKTERIHLVGLHGQTIFHHPHPRRPATLQLGEPAYLVEELKVPVVSNFRAADVAAGGQGAPLATLFHRRIFGQPGLHVCVNNLGGISNVTSIDWHRGQSPKLKSFDTGPANVLIDLAMRHSTHGQRQYDQGGGRARKGNVSERLLSHWLKHEYFHAPPPKSTGRELFGEPFFDQALRSMRQTGLSPGDMLATLTEFTARSLALNYQLHLPSPPDRVVLAGGGAVNSFLVSRIKVHLQSLNPHVEVLTSDALGWPIRTVEAAAFALLAYVRWQHQPGNLPETTGANRPVLLGQLSEP